MTECGPTQIRLPVTDQTFTAPKQDREAVAGRVQKFILQALPGKELEIVVRQRRTKRSDAQNRALWGLAYPTIAKHCGLSGAQEIDDLHEYFLGEHFGWDKKTILGKTKLYPKRRSSKLTKTEFSEFFAFIQRKAAEYGCYVQDPDGEWMLRGVP